MSPCYVLGMTYTFPCEVLEGKGKVLPITNLCDLEGSRGMALLFLNLGIRRTWRGQHHAPTALPPGKTRYPLHRRLGGPHGRSGRVRKISPPPGFFFSGNSIPGSSSPYSVAIPTELPGPSQVLETMRTVVQMARSKICIAFYRSNDGIVGSNSTWDSDICVCVLRVVSRKQ
jgi:hypothetical protein